MPVGAAADERALDSEIEAIARALEEHGETDRRELRSALGARYWGPGRFAGRAARSRRRGPRPARVAARTLAPGGG